MNHSFLSIKAMLTKSVIVVLAMVCITTLTAETGKAKSKRPKPQLASMVPGFEMNRKDAKDEIVKFISCETENECYRTLQELDLGAQAQEAIEGASLVAEFVESPKKGIMVYRKADK